MALDLFQAPSEAKGFRLNRRHREHRPGRADLPRLEPRPPRQCEPPRQHRPRRVGPPRLRQGRPPDGSRDTPHPLPRRFPGRSPCMANAIDADTIMLVGSAPCFPFGTFDPIEELSDLAQSRKHVAACRRLRRRLSRPLRASQRRQYPAVRFRRARRLVDLGGPAQVRLCPQAISTVFYRSEDLANHHGFDFDVLAERTLRHHHDRRHARRWRDCRCLGPLPSSRLRRLSGDRVGLMTRDRSIPKRRRRHPRPPCPRRPEPLHRRDRFPTTSTSSASPKSCRDEIGCQASCSAESAPPA